MQKIPLNLAAAGMVLAKPVMRDNGTVLVAEGTELTDNLLFRLENMHVDNVVVEGSPVAMGDSEGIASGADWGKRLERLDHLFRHHGGDPYMAAVKAWLHEYFAVKAAGVAARTDGAHNGGDGDAANGKEAPHGR
ncbi:MAG: hypothetical protein AB7E47_02485 [Desulfovibrionaceae bacterium]